MPIPLLIPIAIAAGVGASNLKAGSANNNRAKKLNADIQLSLNNAQDKAERAQKRANQCLENLGQIKCEVLSTTINDFITVINKVHIVEFEQNTITDRQNEKIVDKQFLYEMQQFSSMASSVFQGLAGGAGTGALAALGAYSATALLGTASTGTPIAILSGIAAKNATLAFLGGGAIAAGGGGILAGLAGLGGIAAGVTVAILGISVNVSATKNLNKAYSNLAQAEEAVVGLETITMLCKAISKKADMFAELLHNLDELLIKCLNDLNIVIISSGFDYNNYTGGEKAVVAKTLSVVKAIKTVLECPILDDAGNITAESETTYNEVDGQYQKISGSPKNAEKSKKIEQESQQDKITKLIEYHLRLESGDTLFEDKSNRGKKFEASVCFNISIFNETVDNIIGLYDPSPMNCLTGNISGILFCKDRFIFKQKPNDTPLSLKYSEIKEVKDTFIYLHIYGKIGTTVSMKGAVYSCYSIKHFFEEIIDCYKNSR